MEGLTMANNFDFNKLKPKTMSVTLSDDKKTTLLVLMPDKRLHDELSSLYEDIKGVDDEDEVNEALYDLTAKVMSRNKQGLEIDADMLKELYPEIDYILAFLNAYTAFIEEHTSAKN
jgi:hypothetical protein